MRRRFLTLAVVLAVMGFVSWRVWAPSHAPAGQPALETLGAESFTNFERAFDGAAGDVRIILLLSPT